MTTRLAVVLLLTAVIAAGAFAPPAVSRQPRPRAQDAVRQEASAEGAWFVKTETFCRPFPEVKPHLEAHREWVVDYRAARGPSSMTSGYRLDENGKPGGGGLMIFRAADHAAAVAVVQCDPLVANGCVDYAVNEWVSEVGGLQLT
jgi:uncharacterized protein YciI